MSTAIEEQLTEYMAMGEKIIVVAGGSVGDGAWNASQIVGHLIDGVRVNVGRLYANAAGLEPVESWDQEILVRALGYASIPVGALAAELRRCRETFVSTARELLTAGLSPEYLQYRLDAAREHEGEHLGQLRG